QGREALEIAQARGSPSGLALAHYAHGWALMYDDPDTALESFAESVAIVRTGASDMVLAHSLARGAAIRASTGDIHALKELRDALTFALEVGSLITWMTVLDYAIRITAALGQPRLGATIIGFVEGGTNISLNPVEGQEGAARRTAVERI